MNNVVWVDEDDNVLGEVSRTKAHSEAILHRVAVTYLVNEKGQILVNERAKDDHLDHSSAGHLDPGEEYLEAAKRELEEELGVTGLELTEIGKAKCSDQNTNRDGTLFNSRHIFKIYMAKGEPVLLNHDEVKNVWWADSKEVLKDMQISPAKYTAGFRESLKIFLDNSRTV
jgi:isopentenyl-diphosphate delta-isomerase